MQRQSFKHGDPPHSLILSAAAPHSLRSVVAYTSHKHTTILANPMMGSRGRSSSSYYGNGGGVGFFGSPSSERLLLHPAHASSSAAADQLADLDEEDVWSAVTTNDTMNNSHHHRIGARRPAYAGGGLSLAFEAASPPTRHSAPAPVSVPDWPATTTATTGRPEEDLEWVPPHEYLQRRRCGGSSSVLEGAGRTLKGRDITRVRDAVWSKTGFFG